MSDGWICPKCGQVWAPWVARCDCIDRAYVAVPSTTPPSVPPAEVVPVTGTGGTRSEVRTTTYVYDGPPLVLWMS